MICDELIGVAVNPVGAVGAVGSVSSSIETVIVTARKPAKKKDYPGIILTQYQPVIAGFDLPTLGLNNVTVNWKKYDQCVSGAGTTLEVADDLGVWGLGSLAITAVAAGVGKAVEKGSDLTVANLTDALRNQIPTGGRDSSLMLGRENALWMNTTLKTVGKVSGYVTVGATAVSVGVRAYCFKQASSL